MDIVQFRKFGEDLRQPIMEILLGKFHFSHVKRTNTRYLVLLVDHRGGLPLRF